MGNCQAAEVATVVIYHPAENKMERIYWSVSAHEVMSKNPGHYIALVIESRSENVGSPLNQLKLLRPDDILLIGQVYRLITFEDVLKEFAAKKCGKLGSLLKQSGEKEKMKMIRKKKESPRSDQNPKTEGRHSFKVEKEICHFGNNDGISRGMGRRHDGPWRPALPSIAEIGN